MIAIARSWGIPTRYVSGYMYLAGIPGEEVPESATHAWVECLLPDLGWFGFDPTNATIADERHVRIAVGRDYLDVSPTRGILIDGRTLNPRSDRQDASNPLHHHLEHLAQRSATWEIRCPRTNLHLGDRKPM